MKELLQCGFCAKHILHVIFVTHLGGRSSYPPVTSQTAILRGDVTRSRLPGYQANGPLALKACLD